MEDSKVKILSSLINPICMNGERLGILCGMSGRSTSNQYVNVLQFKWDLCPQFERYMTSLKDITDKLDMFNRYNFADDEN